jgi:hypothetical protein
MMILRRSVSIPAVAAKPASAAGVEDRERQLRVWDFVPSGQPTEKP